jgi:hypothetical protein
MIVLVENGSRVPPRFSPHVRSFIAIRARHIGRCDEPGYLPATANTLARAVPLSEGGVFKAACAGGKNATSSIFGSYRPHSSGDGIGAATDVA